MAFHIKGILFCLSLLLIPCDLHSLRFRKDVSHNWPSFCSRTRPLTSDIDRKEASSSAIQKWKVVHLKLDQGEAACVESALVSSNNQSSGNQTSRILHVFRYSDFRQAHPIVHEYSFGIPYLKTDCSCHCPGSNSKCLASSKGGECDMESRTVDSSAGLCKKTYYADGDPAGCSNPSGHANVCCEVTVTPYKGMKFSAVDINQPTIFGTLTYQIYFERNGQWIRATSQDFQVSLGDSSTVQLDEGSIVNLRVTSQGACNCLNRGVYYLEATKDAGKINLYADSAINRLNEWSLTKLGWLRHNESVGWHMDKTSSNLQNMLDVTVQNCKDQTYAESFSHTGYYIHDANHRRVGEPATNPDAIFHSYVGRPIAEREIWVSETSMNPTDRHIIVKHRNPPPLILDFELNSTFSAINFIHHVSFFRDYQAEIRLDTSSNRYLRLVLMNAQGTISGIVRDDENIKAGGVAFDVTGVDAALSNDEYFISLDESVTRRQYVCLRPLTDGGGQLCRWAEYIEKPMENFDVSSNKIITKRGQPCPECDNQAESGFFSRLWSGLNPRNWFSGISGIPESVAFALEIVFYFVIVILVAALCRKLICPMLGWAVCSGPSGKSDKT